MVTNTGMRKMRCRIEHKRHQKCGLGQSKVKTHIKLAGGLMSLRVRDKIRARDSDLVASVIKHYLKLGKSRRITSTRI